MSHHFLASFNVFSEQLTFTIGESPHSKKKDKPASKKLNCVTIVTFVMTIMIFGLSLAYFSSLVSQVMNILIMKFFGINHIAAILMISIQVNVNRLKLGN